MKTVLIADDGLFMRSLLRGMLERNGYEIIGEAENGLEAVDMYEVLNPDLVTMDITMPEMNGVDALYKILQKNPKATIIMISAMGEEKTVKECIEFGAKGFLVKPFNEDTLMTVIDDIDFNE